MAVRLVFHGLLWTLWDLGWALPRIIRRARRTFGSARWATFSRPLNGIAWGDPTGLIAGKKWGQLLRYHGEGALFVYAPQGSGKGVGIVMPNLLDHPGAAVIVTDVTRPPTAVLSE